MVTVSENLLEYYVELERQHLDVVAVLRQSLFEVKDRLEKTEAALASTRRDLRTLRDRMAEAETTERVVTPYTVELESQIRTLNDLAGSMAGRCARTEDLLESARRDLSVLEDRAEEQARIVPEVSPYCALLESVRDAARHLHSHAFLSRTRIVVRKSDYDRLGQVLAETREVPPD